MASSSPEFFTIGSQCINKHDKGIYQSTTVSSTPVLHDVSHVSEIRRVLPVAIPGGSLAPGASVKLPVWVQGCHQGGNHTRDIKFYYESEKKNSKLG